MRLLFNYKVMWVKATLILLFTVALFCWYVFLQLPPSNQKNACVIFSDYPRWYNATSRAQKKWAVPISLQMAIIHQESHFRSTARPSEHYFPPWVSKAKQSTAYGYAQVLDGTWKSYLHANHLKFASRANFFQASDFIGWYVSQLHRNLGIPFSDAYHIYIAYHEGQTGYKHGFYKQKPWLLAVAKKVAQQSILYHKQLLGCHLITAG